MNNNIKKKLPDDMPGFIRSGALSGFVSTLIFTVTHQIFIADIWFSFPVMAAAGILCGICITGSYMLMFKTPSAKSWLKYNLIFIIMFLALGIFSILYFDPVTTVDALMERNQQPAELIMSALPMTIIFTIIFSVIISKLYGSLPHHYAAVFITSIILMAVLGLNVSILGLVEIESNDFILVLELFGFIFEIIFVFAIGPIFLERKKIIIKTEKLIKREQ